MIRFILFCLLHRLSLAAASRFRSGSLWSPELALRSCDAQAQLSHGMWEVLPTPGKEPMFPALTGGFTGTPGVLQSMGSQRVGYDWATELNWTDMCSSITMRLVAQSCLTQKLHELQPVRLLWPWDSPGKSTGVGSNSFHQRFSPTQGSNPGLLHHKQILLPSKPPEKPQ